MTLLPVVLVFALMFCFIQCPKALTVEEYKQIKYDVAMNYLWFKDSDLGDYSLECDFLMEYAREADGKTFEQQTKEDACKYCDIAAGLMESRGVVLPTYGCKQPPLKYKF